MAVSRRLVDSLNTTIRDHEHTIAVLRQRLAEHDLPTEVEGAEDSEPNEEDYASDADDTDGDGLATSFGKLVVSVRFSRHQTYTTPNGIFFEKGRG